MHHKLFLRAILLFWCLWWGIAFLTDFIEVLQIWDYLKPIEFVHARNYANLKQQLAVFYLSESIIFLIFTLIVLATFGVTLCFAIALYQTLSSTIEHKWIDYAFILSLSLWMIFFLADQIIMDFALEANHMTQGAVGWLTYLYVLLTRSNLSSQK